MSKEVRSRSMLTVSSLWLPIGVALMVYAVADGSNVLGSLLR